MSTQVKTAVGRFVWHDHMSGDPAKAKDFYTSLFGWDTEVFKPGEMDYPMIIVNGQGHGGFGPAQGGAPSHWIGHVNVEDVDAAARQAASAGGSVLAGPMDIPDVGRFAAVRDPQGAVLSLFTPKDPDMPTSEGVFVWDELATSDVEGAKRFYGEVVGWTTREMEMADGMAYTLFRSGDADRAGCMAMMPDTPAPMWLTYIGTDDVDATAEKAKELGGTIYAGPTDIPNNIGRFAVIGDPTGAAFGLFKGGGGNA
jgi:predicted enzyme related to lactoylglutathione lyase